LGGRPICIHSWNDGTIFKPLEIRCWTREDAEALIALTCSQNRERYNAIITQLFNVTLSRPLERPLVIEYLSHDEIVGLIGQFGENKTNSLIASLKTYCKIGQELESFFTT